jgi:hypothetical protein
MKKNVIVVTLIILSFIAYGQDKHNHVYFNKLTDIEGTAYVLASIENWGKMLTTNSKYLLFINTETGDTNKVEFPNDGYVREIKQIKIDNLQINRIVVSAQTVDLDGKKGIDWNDPQQIIVLSTDGLERTQLTDDKFFSRTWTWNELTGKIVITGYYDTNYNGKYDKTDKDEILVYDLLTLKLDFKI